MYIPKISALQDSEFPRNALLVSHSVLDSCKHQCQCTSMHVAKNFCREALVGLCLSILKVCCKSSGDMHLIADGTDGPQMFFILPIL